MKLKYHQATFDLLGVTPRSSKSAAAAVASRERALGVALPDSVREWYSLQGVDALMNEAGKLGPFKTLADLGSPIEVEHGLVRVQDECQGVAAWYIRIDGSDDPPVEVQDEGLMLDAGPGVDTGADDDEDWPSTGWAREAESFSAFLYERFQSAGGERRVRAQKQAIKKAGGTFLVDGSGRITLVFFNNTPFTDEMLPSLDGLTSVDALNVPKARLTPEGWSRLARLLSAKQITVSGQAFDDACLARLVELPGFTHFFLYNAAVTDAGLADILARNPLRYLEIGSATQGDAGFAAIGVQTTLEHVALGLTRITDAGLRGLAGMPALTSLVLTRTPVTDAGLEPLARVPRLRSLALNGTGIQGPGLRHLAGLAELQDLDLSSTPVGDTAAPHLARIVSLRKLNLAETRLTDEGVSLLAELPVLGHLDVSLTPVTDAAVERLRKTRTGVRIVR